MIDDTKITIIIAGAKNLHVICQYSPGLMPVISWMSLVNFSCPYTYITEIISISASTIRPMVPAKESNMLSQYSPAPVVKMIPILKQTKQTEPEISYYQSDAATEFFNKYL